MPARAGHPGRRLRRDHLAAGQGGRAGARERHDPRGHVLPALPLGPPARLLQERQQPDALPRRIRCRASRSSRRCAVRLRPLAVTRAPGARMNKIEALKAEKDGLDVTEDLVRFAREGWKTIADDDKERLKWVGRLPAPAHARPLHDARPHAERHRDRRAGAAPRRDHASGPGPANDRRPHHAPAGAAPLGDDRGRPRGDRAPRGGRALDAADRDGQHPRHRRLPGHRAHARRALRHRADRARVPARSSSATRSSPTCRASST